MNMAKQILNEQKKKELFELYESGQYLNSEIASMFGIKRNTVHLICRQMRLQKETETRG